MSEQMQAVIYEGPYNMVVKSVPRPYVDVETDAILKVELSALCGSDLHMYRGHQKTSTGHIMGHEFIGTVESKGSAVTRFEVGQRVMSVFSPMCMQCWNCVHGYTNRCVHGISFGSERLNGGQAEYVRVPFANSTLEALPEAVPVERMLLMCDIFPTGYYGAMRAITKVLRNTDTAKTVAQVQGNLPVVDGIDSVLLNPQFTYQKPEDLVVLCLGCGPVGLCAILTAKVLVGEKGTVVAVDNVADRLDEARKMGAVTLNLTTDDIVAEIKKMTDGRGADAVVESVGNKPALRLAYDAIRVCGGLSSIGFHQGDLPFTAAEAYAKNIECVPFVCFCRRFPAYLFTHTNITASTWAVLLPGQSLARHSRSLPPIRKSLTASFPTRCQWQTLQRPTRCLKSRRRAR